MSDYGAHKADRVAELEAEVERLRATKDEERGMRRACAQALAVAEAERDAFQQRLDEVMPEVEMWREHFLDDVREVERQNALAAPAVSSRPGMTVTEAVADEPQPTPEAVRLCLSRHGDWFQHVAGRYPCVGCRRDAARQSEPVEPQPTPEATCACWPPGDIDSEDGHDGDCPLWVAHRSARQSEPVERITDANGDEEEECDETCAPHLHQFCSPRCEANAQQQGGGEGPLRHEAHCPHPVYPCVCGGMR